MTNPPYRTPNAPTAQKFSLPFCHYFPPPNAICVAGPRNLHLIAHVHDPEFVVWTPPDGPGNETWLLPMTQHVYRRVYYCLRSPEQFLTVFFHDSIPADMRPLYVESLLKLHREQP